MEYNVSGIAYLNTITNKLIVIDGCVLYLSGNPTLKLYGTAAWNELKYHILCRELQITMDTAKEVFNDYYYRKYPNHIAKHPDILKDHETRIGELDKMKFKDQNDIVKVQVKSIIVEPMK